MENSNIILNKLTAIESLLEATHLDKLTAIESLLEGTHQVKPRTLVEAAKFLDLSPSHLYKLTSERKIPHFKPNGKKIYFDEDELVQWLKRKPTRTLEETEAHAASYIVNQSRQRTV